MKAQGDRIAPTRHHHETLRTSGLPRRAVGSARNRLFARGVRVSEELMIALEHKSACPCFVDVDASPLCTRATRNDGHADDICAYQAPPMRRTPSLEKRATRRHLKIALMTKRWPLPQLEINRRCRVGSAGRGPRIGGAIAELPKGIVSPTANGSVRCHATAPAKGATRHTDGCPGQSGDRLVLRRIRAR
jgi:hypothetical protein